MTRAINSNMVSLESSRQGLFNELLNVAIQLKGIKLGRQDVEDTGKERKGYWESGFFGWYHASKKEVVDLLRETVRRGGS